MWRRKHAAPPPLTSCPTYQDERRQVRQEIEQAQEAANDAVVESTEQKRKVSPMLARLRKEAALNSFAQGWLATIERRPS